MTVLCSPPAGPPCLAMMGAKYLPHGSPIRVSTWINTFSVS